jgi:hypothetical protein
LGPNNWIFLGLAAEGVAALAAVAVGFLAGLTADI